MDEPIEHLGDRAMGPIYRLSALAFAGCATAGCSRIAVTSNALVNGTARLADATTDAAQGASDATSDMMCVSDKQPLQRKIMANDQILFCGKADAGEWLGRCYKVAFRLMYCAGLLWPRPVNAVGVLAAPACGHAGFSGWSSNFLA